MQLAGVVLLQRQKGVFDLLGVGPGKRREVRPPALHQMMHLLDDVLINKSPEDSAQKTEIGGRIVEDTGETPAPQ